MNEENKKPDQEFLWSGEPLSEKEIADLDALNGTFSNFMNELKRTWK